MTDPFGLATAWQRFRQHWEQTKVTWNDLVSRNFEKMLIVPLAEQEERTLRELGELMHVIDQARRNVR